MKRIGYANVASALALVVALSSGAYAVTNLPKNSVGTEQLKSGAVTSKKVRDGGLRAEDLAPGSTLPPGSGVRLAAAKALLPCAENLVLARTIRPRSRSRLLGIVAGNWTANQQAGYSYELVSNLQLREAGLVVGRTAKLTNESTGGAPSDPAANVPQPLGSSGVLLGNGGAPTVLKPKKEYTLELVAHTYGIPCANNPMVGSAELSFLLLADRG